MVCELDRRARVFACSDEELLASQSDNPRRPTERATLPLYSRVHSSLLRHLTCGSVCYLEQASNEQIDEIKLFSMPCANPPDAGLACCGRSRQFYCTGSLAIWRPSILQWHNVLSQKKPSHVASRHISDVLCIDWPTLSITESD